MINDCSLSLHLGSAISKTYLEQRSGASLQKLMRLPRQWIMRLQLRLWGARCPIRANALAITAI